MSAVEHARALLKSAYRDFRALTGMQDSGLFADEIFGFHAQQAIEKGLKAWIAGLEIEYRALATLRQFSLLPDTSIPANKIKR